MAFSNDLLTMDQPWLLQSSFDTEWTSDFFKIETETLTKALQVSMSNTNSTTTTTNTTTTSSSNGDVLTLPEFSPSPAVSAGSENEVPMKGGRRKVPPTGRVTKRKPRASKRAATTYIAADPENFMRMVQQFTGGFDGGDVLKTFDPVVMDGGDEFQVAGNYFDGFCSNNNNNNFPTLESWNL